MRVNVYAEEIPSPPRIEIVSKTINGQVFTGLRFYLELPCTVAGQEYQGPFLHRGDNNDDDSAAVTFWGKRSLMPLLKAGYDALAKHYEKHEPFEKS